MGRHSGSADFTQAAGCPSRCCCLALAASDDMTLPATELPSADGLAKKWRQFCA